MGRLHELLLVLAIAVCTACAQPKTPFDEKLARGGFALVFGEAADERGFDVLQIAHNGECRYVFKSNGGTLWRELEFRVDSETVRALKRELNRASLLGLESGELTSIAGEAPRAFLWLRVGRREKLVSVQGVPPSDFAELAQFLRERLIRPQRLRSQNAPILDAARAHDAAKVGDDRQKAEP